MSKNNVVALKAGNPIAAIIPTSIEETYRLSEAISQSGLAPSGMKTPQQIMVAIMHGLEIGLPPMQALQRIAVVNGRPTIWGDALPALLLSRGFRLKEWLESEGEKTVAYCEVTRPDGDVITRSFSVDDAKTAGLWGKQGPWRQYWKRMIQMRARGFACRDGAADALSGLYMTEEVQDEPDMKDVTPKRAGTVPDIPDIPTEAEASQDIDYGDDTGSPEGAMRDVERQIEAATSVQQVNKIQAANSQLLMQLDEESRDSLIEAIEARKEQLEGQLL